MCFNSTRSKGQEGEALALEYLKEAGYLLIERNYRVRYGEIDLIMEDPKTKTVVFVEVKSGNSDKFPAYQEGINSKKCEKISKVALCFIENLTKQYEAFRIDAVFVERGGCNQIQHLKNIYCLA